MKAIHKRIALLALVIFPNLGFSQSFMGMHLFQNEAYSVGMFNPAMPATSKVRFQIGLIGSDFSFENNFLKTGGPLLGANNNGSDDIRGYFVEELNGKDKDLFLKAEVRPISLVLNFDKVGTFTFGTRFRLLAGLTDMSQDLAISLFRHDTKILDWQNQFTSRNVNAAMNAVSEVSFGYSRQILETDAFKLYGGATIKSLIPIFTAYVRANDIQFTHTDTTLSAGTTNFDFIFSDNQERVFASGAPESLSDVIKPNGFAFDLGLAATFKINDDLNGRAGISVTDWGRYSFNASQNSRRFRSSGAFVPESAVFNFGANEYYNLDTIMGELGNYERVTGKVKHNMPTRLNINADVTLKDFRFGYMANFNMIGSDSKIGGAFLPTNHMLTAGYEIKEFGVAVPFSYNSFRQFGAGLVLHSRFLTIGTTNLVSSLFQKNSGAVNLFFSINFIALKKD